MLLLLVVLLFFFMVLLVFLMVLFGRMASRLSFVDFSGELFDL